jgi:dynein heavy chain
VLAPGVVVVNFHPELRVLMSEAHYLDRKGFNIPPLALQVALQEDEYRAWTERLEWLLELYYKVGWLSHSCRLQLLHGGH